jgi:hypothetical protein
MDANRRALEKARMKFDKLVTPVGPKPVKRERVAAPKPSKPAPEPVVQPPDDNDLIIADHYDDNPENPTVLFEQSEFYGLFNFRDTILDQLDRYWVYLERMRRHDASAFGYYRQVGMQLLPYMTCHLNGRQGLEAFTPLTEEELAAYKREIELPPMFNAARPAFGCIAFGANPKVESWEKENKKLLWPRFLYFTKYTQPPPEVQMIYGGDIYKMTVWWDKADVKKVKHGVPTDFVVFVSKDGKHLQLLKTCEMRWIKIKAKRSLRKFAIPDRSWHIPDDYSRWAKQFNLDPETHLTHVFTQALYNQECAQYGDIRVQVHKDDLTAVFNIDSRRMSYFFQDRDIELTGEGQRKRIFHVVRPQLRKNGTAVRMHYRGERNFSWAGYDVAITVPGLHHLPIEEFGVGAVDQFWQEKGKRYVNQTKVGEMVAGWIDGGVGRYKT